MPKKTVTPRIQESARSWYGEHFSSAHAGIAFVLESVPELYKRTLLELRGRFTGSELKLVVDVYNATALTPGMPMLEAQVVDGIKLDGLDQKWGIDGDLLTGKVHALTSFQQAVLEIWANGYWYAHADQELPDLEEYVAKITK